MFFMLSFNLGVYIIKGLIWLALLLYLAGLAALRAQSPRGARWFYSAGCLAYLLHVVMGFQGYYAWSHEAAYEVMALQTYDLVKVRTGAAIYVNYLFTVVWLAEVLWSWISFDRWRRRSKVIHWLVHGFMVVVFLCGMVLFTAGPVRWFSLGCFLALGLAGLVLPTSSGPHQTPNSSRRGHGTWHP